MLFIEEAARNKTFRSNFPLLRNLQRRPDFCFFLNVDENKTHMEELENQPTVTFLFNSEQYGVPIEGGRVNLQAVAEHFGVPTSALQAQTKTGPRALLCESDGMSKISTWEDGTSVTLVIPGTYFLILFLRR